MKFLSWAAAVIAGTLIFKAFCGKTKCFSGQKNSHGPRKGQILVAPTGAATIQNTGKCPHGLPVGTCPICNGMSGGGGVRKDKDKPRVAGEMSYNECMAAWIKIQAAKEAKIQAQIERMENLQTRYMENRLIHGLDKINKTLDKITQNLEQMPKIIAIPAKIFINVIVKPILNLIAKIPQIINNIQTLITNIKNFISSVSEKLASVFGEVKNFIDAKIAQPLKKAIKTVLSFFSQGEEEENEEVEKLKSREIKKVLKNLFRIKNKDEKEQEENEEEQ